MSWGLGGSPMGAVSFGEATISGGHLELQRIYFQIEHPTVLEETLEDKNTP